MSHYERSILYMSAGLASIAISLSEPRLGWVDVLCGFIGIGFLAISFIHTLRFVFSDEE